MTAPGEPSFQALVKLQDMIDQHDFKRAHKTITQHLSQHPKAANVLFKSLNALCLAKMSRLPEAVETADALIAANPGGILDSSALSSICYVYRLEGRLQSIADAYKVAWEKSQDVSHGEAYVMSLAVLNNFVEMQKAAMSVFKRSQDVKHQLWSIVGNILAGNVALMGLSGKMIQKLATDKKFETKSVVARQEIALLYLYVLFQSGIGIDKVILDVLGTLATSTPILLGLTPGWIVNTLVDELIDRKDTATAPVLKTLTLILIGIDSICADAANATCLIPRENWKYYETLLKLKDVEGATLPDAVLGNLSLTASAFDDSVRKLSLVELFSKVSPPNSRTFDLAMLHARRACGESDAAMQPSVLTFIQSWAPKNAWVCYLDVKPFLSKEFVVAHTAVLESFPALYGQAMMTLQHNMGAAKEVAKKILDSQAGARNTHGNTTAALLLMAAGQPVTALTVLESTQAELKEPCSQSYLLRSLISGKLMCMDASSLVPEIALRNIQFDTMQYIYFDALIEGYHTAELYQACESAAVFYNTSLRQDVNEIVASAMMHGTWHVLTHQLSQTRDKLRYSFHRCETVVWGIVVFIERNTASEAAERLPVSTRILSDLDDAIAILQSQREKIQFNEDTGVLESHLWKLCKVAPLSVSLSNSERIDKLLSFALLVQSIVRNTATSEAVVQLCDALIAETSTVNSLKKAVHAMFPGVTLVSHALHATTAGKAIVKEYAPKVIQAISAVTEYVHHGSKQAEGIVIKDVLPDFFDGSKTVKTAQVAQQGMISALVQKAKQRTSELQSASKK